MNQYLIKIPLTYNTCDVQAIYPKDMFQRWGLKEPITWVESRCEEQENTSLSFSITCDPDMALEDGIFPKDEYRLTIKGVLAEEKRAAIKSVQKEIHRACLALSMLISDHNRGNKQSFQERVIPEYERIEITEIPKRAEGGERKGVLFPEIKLGETEVSITLYGEMHTGNFQKYYEALDSRISFLMEEYYAALGAESMTSKFFHLFSMIEFVEQAYGQLSGAQKLFLESEKEEIETLLDKNLKWEKTKKERLMNFIKGNLSRMTDLGRSARWYDCIRTTWPKSPENTRFSSRLLFHATFL